MGTAGSSCGCACPAAGWHARTIHPTSTPKPTTRKRITPSPRHCRTTHARGGATSMNAPSDLYPQVALDLHVMCCSHDSAAGEGARMSAHRMAHHTDRRRCPATHAGPPSNRAVTPDGGPTVTSRLPRSTGVAEGGGLAPAVAGGGGEFPCRCQDNHLPVPDPQLRHLDRLRLLDHPRSSYRKVARSSPFWNRTDSSRRPRSTTCPLGRQHCHP